MAIHDMMQLREYARDLYRDFGKKGRDAHS